MVEFRKISTDKLRAMDEAARKRELEAFECDPSIKMPLSGFAKHSVVDWHSEKKSQK